MKFFYRIVLCATAANKFLFFSMVSSSLFRRRLSGSPSRLDRDSIAAIECLRHLYSERRWPDLLSPPRPPARPLPGLPLPPAADPLPTGRTAVVARLRELLAIRRRPPVWLEWWWSGESGGDADAERALDRLLPHWQRLGAVAPAGADFSWNLPRMVELMEVLHAQVHPAVERPAHSAQAEASRRAASAAERRRAEENKRWSVHVFLGPGEAEALLRSPPHGSEAPDNPG